MYVVVFGIINLLNVCLLNIIFFFIFRLGLSFVVNVSNKVVFFELGGLRSKVILYICLLLE